MRSFLRTACATLAVLTSFLAPLAAVDYRHQLRAVEELVNVGVHATHEAAADEADSKHR